MTKLLDHAMAVARNLPPMRQDELARRLIAALRADGDTSEPASPGPGEKRVDARRTA